MPSNQDRIKRFYEKYNEGERLFTGAGQLEFARTLDILEKYLPKPPATILDIGGADGIYSAELAKQSYDVHLIDLTPSNVEKAKELSKKQPDFPIASCTVGDACKLDWDDSSADVVLLMGPMYHLIEREDRIVALKEARRVLKPGGLLLVMAITRWASALDGIFFNFFDNPKFYEIVKRDLATGRHINPTENINYFTDSYFHRPEEVTEEITESGFRFEKLIPVEGPMWMIRDFDERWDDPEKRARMFELICKLEQEDWMLSVSSHIIGIGYK